MGAAAVGIAACSDTGTATRIVGAPEVFLGAIANLPGDGEANGESFEVCKSYRGFTGTGPTVTINVQTVANGPNGTSTAFSTTLADGECKVIWTTGQEGETVTVTEVVPTDFTASYVKVTSTRPGGSGTTRIVDTLPEAPGNTASGNASGAPIPSGTLIRFINTYTPPPPPPAGCSYTIGYWKTHAGFTGNNADVVSQYLPISLGTSGGAKSLVVTDAASAVHVLSMGTGSPSNGIVKLYAQLLAAKLNIASGANGSAVAATIAAADAFLAANNVASWTSLSGAQKGMVNGWMSTLDSYNNGLIGPGHCV